VTALGSRSAAATAHGQIDGRSHPAYAEYRLSGVDWFQDVPAHWSVAPLYSRYEVQLGKMLDTSRITGRYLAPYLRNVDVQWDCVNINDLPAMDFPPSVRERYRLARGDLLVCEGGEVGRTAIWQDELEECYYQKAVHRLRRRRPDEHPRFLFYVMQAAASQGAFRAGSSLNTIDHLTAEKLRRHRLPFAPSDEQRAVSEFLDRETENIDALVAKKQRLIELLQEKRTALISHAVTKGLDPDVPMQDSGITGLGAIPAHWDFGVLRRAARLESGHTPSRQHLEYWEGCDIPWFTLADIWQVRPGIQEYVRATAECVSEAGLANSSARLLPAGTVLLSRTASVGYSAIAKCPMATSQDFANWICGDALVPEYLLYVFRSMHGELMRLTMGSTHKTIYMPIIAKLAGPLPPMDEQRRIVEHIRRETRQVDALDVRLAQAMERLREYRSALITAAVTGQIDVRTYRQEAS